MNKLEEQYRRANDNIHIREERYMTMKRDVQIRKRSTRTIQAVAAVLAFAVLGGGVWAIFAKGRSDAGNQVVTGDPKSTAGISYQSPNDALASLTQAGMKLESASDYDDLLVRLTAMRDRSNEKANGFLTPGMAFSARGTGAAADMTAPEAEADTGGGDFKMISDDVAAPIAETVPQEGDAQKEHSGTNTQVAQVDEADIVKTDGDYIYVLSPSQSKLFVVSTDGAEMAVTSSFSFENKEENVYTYTNNMYVYGDRLFVIMNYDRYGVARTDKDGASTKMAEVVLDNESRTQVLTFDISDRSDIKKLSEMSQSGYYSDSRLTDGFLYLVSNYYVYQEWIEGAPITYCPTLRSGTGAVNFIPAADILLYEQGTDSSYTVIGSIDCATGTAYDSAKALYGVSGSIYCDGSNLLISSYAYENGESEQQWDEKGPYIDRFGGSATNVVLFGLNKGTITQKAAAKIPGNLLNQFSMDAYNGYFRFVVTRNNHSQRIYTEGIDTYGDYNSTRDNALYVLDGKLNMVGKLEELGKNETVQSVRFSGDIAYFVTFLRTDPLFTVDLSDAANPKVLSELKIPGFSAYLHMYGEGLMVGIGYDADEETGRTTGVKLSMFDVRDKADVREAHIEKLKADWTTVDGNHKAALIVPEKNLIAFPADGCYYVYGYDAQEGFSQKGKIQVNTDKYYYMQNTRGLYIDSVFYVADENAVIALDLESMEKLATLKLK